jgi:membrane carboxypeptidase/penicillin-binding protein PbpC
MKNMPKVAFKTGTSAYAKDMLTIGYTPQYTVGVWFGNFSAKASKKSKKYLATGLRVASPTLFKIFKELGSQSWFKRPKGIVKKEICQDAIVIGECKKRVSDLVIKDTKLKTPCSAMHAEVLSYLISNKTIIDYSYRIFSTIIHSWLKKPKFILVQYGNFFDTLSLPFLKLGLKKIKVIVHTNKTFKHLQNKFLLNLTRQIFKFFVDEVYIITEEQKEIFQHKNTTKISTIITY